MKNKKIIVIPPNFAIGDAISAIGLLNYLLTHYGIVYFYLGKTTVTRALLNYFNDYFSNDDSFNKRIILTIEPEELINNGQYGEYHICNTLTGGWNMARFDFFELPNIDKEFYFNDLNPIYNQLNVLDSHKTSPNKHLPNKEWAINHIFYYELIGLNNNVRMDYFDYVRNIKREEETKKHILNKMGIVGKYNIINNPINDTNQLTSCITNGYPIIDIHYLSESPGNLITLLEGAETINFIEGSNVNFFYHCQYKNIFKYDKEINLHIWLRNRNWGDENMKLDYAWKMMTTPQLENWNIIMDKPQI